VLDNRPLCALVKVCVSNDLDMQLRSLSSGVTMALWHSAANISTYTYSQGTLPYTVPGTRLVRMLAVISTKPLLHPMLCYGISSRQTLLGVRAESIPQGRSLGTLSNTAKGRIYEQACQRYLHEELAIEARACGGAGDQGIDLRGTWKTPRVHNVIIQCKHYSKKVGPSTVREMEGSVSSYSVNGSSHASVLSIICAQSGFSEAAWKRATASQFPVLLLHLAIGDRTIHGNSDTRSLAPAAICHGAWSNPSFSSVTGDILLQETILQLRASQTPLRYVRLRRRYAT
jgi:HJR/Mrr/RecB family endonuclease